MRSQTSEYSYWPRVLSALLVLAIALFVVGCAALGTGDGDQDKPSPQVLKKKAGALAATSSAPATNAQQRVTRALDTIYGDRTTARELTYYSKFVDLNGDGHNEAVAFVVGPEGCTEGCDLYVLQPKGKRYQIISRIPTSKVPVYALDQRSHGWRDLVVTTDHDKGGSDRQLMQYADGGYMPVGAKPADDAERMSLIFSLHGDGYALHPKRDADRDKRQ